MSEKQPKALAAFNCNTLPSRSGLTGQADTHKLRLWVPSVLLTPARLTASV